KLGKNAFKEAFNNENSMIINMCKDSADVFKNKADKDVIKDDREFILKDRQAKMEAFEFEIKKAALASAIQAEKNKEKEDSKRKEDEEDAARKRKEDEEEKARIKKEAKEEKDRLKDEAKQEAVRVKEAKAANEAQNKITNIEMQLAKDWALNANGASTLQPVKQEEEKEQPKPLSSVGVSVAEVTDKKDLSAAGQQLDSVYEQNNRILETDKANYQKELNKAETALNEKINEFLNYDFNTNKLKASEVSNESRILFIDKTFKEHPDEFSNLNRANFNKIKHLEQLAKNCRDDVDKQKKQINAQKAKIKDANAQAGDHESQVLKEAEDRAKLLKAIAEEGRWIKNNAYKEKEKMYAFFKQVQVNARTAMGTGGIEAAKIVILSNFDKNFKQGQTNADAAIQTGGTDTAKEVISDTFNGKLEQVQTNADAKIQTGDTDAAKKESENPGYNVPFKDDFKKEINLLNNRVNEMKNQVAYADRRIEANKADMTERQNQLEQTGKVLQEKEIEKEKEMEKEIEKEIEREKETEKEKEKVKPLSLDDFNAKYIPSKARRERLKNRQPSSEKQAEQEKSGDSMSEQVKTPPQISEPSLSKAPKGLRN
ncbi:MAG: hypothetical protein LIO87_01380, partial [Eubacterium sp.]|nr:hypothetical protein [Eubacterium sp.]